MNLALGDLHLTTHYCPLQEEGQHGHKELRNRKGSRELGIDL